MRKIIFILVLLVLVNGCAEKDRLDSTVTCDDGRKVSMSEGCIPDDGLNFFEETSNLKCAPAQCCHPTSCVFEKDAPNCKGMICTMECKPGTLDCGQGSCKCLNGNCEAVYN